MKKNIFIVSVCALALLGCSCPKTCIQSCPVCPAQAVQPIVQTSGNIVAQTTCEQKGGKWHTVRIQSNWGTDGLLFYFAEEKNHFFNLGYQTSTPIGYSSSKKLLNLHLTDKETINLCMKRIGTQEYWIVQPKYDATVHAWVDEKIYKNASSFEVLDSETYKCPASAGGLCNLL